MATSKKKEHTGFRNGDLFCFNCGESFSLQLPRDASFAADIMKAFSKAHKTCSKTWTEPVATPDTAMTYESEDTNERWWLTHGEQGISSKTMFRYLTDGKPSFKTYNCEPSDPADFRRCHLLLEAIPQYRQKLDRLKQVSTYWGGLVDNWDKLTVMLEEQMKTNKPNGMYEFMRSLRTN